MGNNSTTQRHRSLRLTKNKEFLSVAPLPKNEVVQKTKIDGRKNVHQPHEVARIDDQVVREGVGRFFIFVSHFNFINFF
jgi:hypothetical protein